MKKKRRDCNNNVVSKCCHYCTLDLTVYCGSGIHRCDDEYTTRECGPNNVYKWKHFNGNKLYRNAK